MNRLNDEQQKRLLKVSRNLAATPEETFSRILEMAEVVINLKLNETQLIVMVPVDINGDMTRENAVGHQPLPFNFNMLGTITDISYDDTDEVVSIPFRTKL